VEDVIERARAGEPRAVETLRETAFHLGRGLATIVKAIDPRRVYMGGEITAAWDLIGPLVRQAMRDQALIPEAGETEIFTVALADHPRLRGAAALVSTPAFAAPIVA
jgi:predicted NBD/HSP70 family sugar kinase